MSLLTQLDSDLGAVLYDTASGFAELATATGGGTTVVIFDLPFYSADAGITLEVGNGQPRARMLDADAAGHAIGAVLTIRSIDYTIIQKQPNGQGENVLTLRQV